MLFLELQQSSTFLAGWDLRQLPMETGGIDAGSSCRGCVVSTIRAWDSIMRHRHTSACSAPACFHSEGARPGRCQTRREALRPRIDLVPPPAARPPPRLCCHEALLLRDTPERGTRSIPAVLSRSCPCYHRCTCFRTAAACRRDAGGAGYSGGIVKSMVSCRMHAPSARLPRSLLKWICSFRPCSPRSCWLVCNCPCPDA